MTIENYTLDQLQLKMADLISRALQLSSNNVRIAFQHPGQPSPDRADDVVYISMDFKGNQDIYKDRETIYDSPEDEFVETTKYFCRMSAQFKCYGPNCFENALRIKEKLFTENVKWELGQLNLFLIPDAFTGPIYSRDYLNGHWVRIGNLGCEFYNARSSVERIPSIKDIEIIYKEEN